MYCLPNPLENKWHTIEVSYVAWGCDCAEWNLDVDDGVLLEGDAMHKENIFIEPASTAVVFPDSLFQTGSSVRFTGQFYKNKGFPKGYYSQEQPEKARIFRYTKFNVLNSN